MSSANVKNLAFCVFLSLIFAAGYTVRVRRVERARIGDYPRKKANGAIVEPMILVFFIAFLLWLCLPSFLSGKGENSMIWLFLVLVNMGVYYVILLCAMPLLRRTIKAYACSALWVMPGILYCFMGYSMNIEPVFMVSVPKRLMRPVITAWLVGAGFVLSAQLISHFIYRHRLRKSVIEKAPTEFSDRWENECNRLGIKREIPVYISDSITTPVTVGLFALTMRLYLPNRSYTDEELGFIFRHEAQHIAHNDTRSKFLLGVLAAVNWFNPFVWIAMRKAAEDFELYCDEEVLYYAYPDERRAYAGLLLESADSSQGYSTCLSASARSLKYRLKSVLHPKKRFSGALAVFISMMILLLGMGTVGVADSETVTVGEYFDIPENPDIDYISAKGISRETITETEVYGCDEIALTEYICSLRIREIILGDFDEFDDDRFFSLTFSEETTDFRRKIDIYEKYLSIRGQSFILEDEVDWDYLNSLLDYSAPNPDPSSVAPWAYIYAEYADYLPSNDQPFSLAREVIAATRDGEPFEVLWAEDSEGGIGGAESGSVTGLRLEFNYEPRDGYYTVTVENWDRTESYTLTGAELVDGKLPVEEYSAHYTIEATFDTYKNTTYEMRFRFGIQYEP